MDPITGALVGALFNEVILALKTVYRCENNCKNLTRALEGLKPLVRKVEQSSDKGDATYQVWLASVHALLVEANGLTEQCSSKSASKSAIPFMNRKRLSTSLEDITKRIKNELGVQINLVVLDTTQVTRDTSQEALDVGRRVLVTTQVTRDTSQEALDVGRRVLDTTQVTRDTSQEALDVGRRVLDTTQVTRDISQETLDVGQRILAVVEPKHSRQCVKSAAAKEAAAFEKQPVPSKTVAFEKDPFKRLKEVIICAADAPSGEALTVGLKGRGGAGKTLLVKMVNNDKDIQQKYGAGSILWITIGNDASVSSTYERMGKFLEGEDVFKRECAKRNLEDQRTYLMEAFKKKRTLLILDDVWENSCSSRAMIHWLDISKGCGSTTLITTRNGSVLDRAKAKERIEVLSLSKEESWKLFCYHAFEATIPPSVEFQNTAKKICEECKGLPLALEVIGGALWGKKDVRDWESALHRLKNSESMCNSRLMEDELFHRLKFSYDELKEETKRCFLYFAAFPEDYQISTEELCSIWHAEKLFSSCGYKDKFIMGRENLVALADRSLIDLEEDGGHARIHDVLRDLAIHIIREARVGEWAFACHFEPAKVLESFPKMKETTKRVSFVGSTIKHCEASHLLQVPYMEVCLLSGLSMPNDGFCIPYAFSKCMNTLVYLDLSSCYDLEELPESMKELKSLMYLDISWCWRLKELPESIKELKSLMHLDLSNCLGLKELPESIKELKSLVHLSLSECGSLKELPESIKELKFLMHLDISGCHMLKKLPEIFEELKFLVHLNLSGCWRLKELPESIKELKTLQHLDLSKCYGLEKLPESIKELKSLIHLNLSRCKGLKELLESIKELKSLQHLNLSRCDGLEELSESIMELKSHQHLNLSGCDGLEECLTSQTIDMVYTMTKILTTKLFFHENL